MGGRVIASTRRVGEKTEEALRWLAAVIIVMGAVLLILLFPDAFTDLARSWRPILPFPGFTTVPTIGGGFC